MSFDFVLILSWKLSIFFSRSVKLYSRTGMISFKSSAHDFGFMFDFSLLLLELIDTVSCSNNSSLYNYSIDCLIFFLNGNIYPSVACFLNMISIFFSSIEKLYSSTPIISFMSKEHVLTVCFFFCFFEELDKSFIYCRN